MSTRRVLLFVPAVVASPNQSAGRIAGLLAQAATKARPGTWTAQATARSASVIGPSGTTELEVIRVDYLSTLMRHTRGVDAKPSTRQVFSSLRFALLGTARVARPRLKHLKSPKAKVQLTLAFFAVILLWLCFAILLLALVAAVASVWAPDWALRDTTGGKLVLSGGVLGALIWLYWRTRAGLLLSGDRLRAIMGYFEHHGERLYLTSILDEAVDGILEETPDAEIHVFAFSFGSIVALDALFPDDVAGAVVERRALDQVASLVTVGCPADLVRMLYPDHFSHRVARRVDLGDAWTNVFMPLDILASNFANQPSDGPVPDTGEVERLDIAGALPRVGIPVGPSDMSRWAIPLLRGFVVHGSYWDDHQPRHLEPLLPLWLPAPAAALPPGISA